MLLKLCLTLLIIGVTGLSALGLAGSAYWTHGLGLSTRAGPALSGQALLDAFQCRFAETRTVQIRGVEDGFSPAGTEPSRPPRWMAGVAPTTHLLPIDYDQVQVNAYVIDQFELDPLTVSGLFVMSVQTVFDDVGDTLFIGEIEDTPRPLEERNAPIFHQSIARLETLPGWSRDGTLVWANLDAISMVTTMVSPERRRSVQLLDLVQSADQILSIDVMISDDTAVDFMAMVTCTQPAQHGGYTMQVHDLAQIGFVDIVVLSAEHNSREGGSGNPFLGDTDCDTPVPLACYHDDRSAAPMSLDVLGTVQVPQSLLAHWSGGTIRATEPVRGSEFATIVEADAACAHQFGLGWRVADHHLGGQGFTFASHAIGMQPNQRVWIDIKDQPYGTCWSRPRVTQ